MLFFTRIGAARSALLLSAGLTIVTPVLAQNAAFNLATSNAATAPLREALAAKKVSLSVEVSALDGSWRRFKPTKEPEVQSKLIPGEAATKAFYSYLTRGERIEVGGKNLLVAYRTRSFGGLLPQDFGKESMTKDKYLMLLPEQTLWLCLFDADSVGELGEGRAYNVDIDGFLMHTMAERARYSDRLLIERSQLEPLAANRRVESDFQKIGLSLRQYIQDYDEKLPPMRSSQSMASIREYEGGTRRLPARATVQQLVGPYLKAPEVFSHPTTRQIYRPNFNLSGRGLSRLQPSAKVIAFYEASPAPDGTRAVLYLDGHVKRERETDWAAIRAASDRIAPPFKVGKRSMNAKPASGTVTLYDAAAMAYMLRRQRDNEGRPQTVYLSKSTNRIYYRDAKTKQAIWLSSPEGTTASDGITTPYEQAQEFREFQGYDGQTFGRIFGGYRINAAIVTPKIKTAMGANSALKGSMINVDTLVDNKTVTLRGTTTSNAQKVMAEAIAKKNAPGFLIVNELVVK